MPLKILKRFTKTEHFNTPTARQEFVANLIEQGRYKSLNS
jgi:hypothetical protein